MSDRKHIFCSCRNCKNGKYPVKLAEDLGDKIRVTKRGHSTDIDKLTSDDVDSKK